MTEIYNVYVATSTAIYDFDPRPVTERESWLHEQIDRGYPTLVALDSGRPIGWSSLSPLGSEPDAGYKQ